MNPLELTRIYLDLTTPHVADAIMRLGIPVRFAPPGIRSLWADTHIVGRARPVRHYGSVDVFLEALESSERGEVLVVDNAGRDDESCVGDLVTLEVQNAGLSGIVIWGLHRDTTELRTLHLPVFSTGTLPIGPQRLDPQEPDALAFARVGAHTVTVDDFVLGDDDGVLFLPLDRAAEIAEQATAIRDTERHQAARMNLATASDTRHASPTISPCAIRRASRSASTFGLWAAPSKNDRPRIQRLLHSGTTWNAAA